jgi:hypothetical protein
VAIAVAVGVAVTVAPVAADAVPTALFSIVDGTNQSLRAKVDSSGALKVGDSFGALTVDGNVGMTVPARPFSYAASGDEDLLVLRNTDPAAVILAITHLTVSTFDNGGGTMGLTLLTQEGDSCGDATRFDFEWRSHIKQNDTVQAVFPSPLVVTVSPGWVLCMAVSPGGSAEPVVRVVSVVGFVA